MFEGMTNEVLAQKIEIVQDAITKTGFISETSQKAVEDFCIGKRVIDQEIPYDDIIDMVLCQRRPVIGDELHPNRNSIQKTFDGKRVLDDISNRQLSRVSLSPCSGRPDAERTTLLRCLAGLENIDGGKEFL